MAKCSDFSQLLHDLAMAVAHEDPKITTVDAALRVIAQDVPQVKREHVTDAIVEVLESRKKERREIKRTLRYLRAEAKKLLKRESRKDVNLRELISTLGDAILEERLPAAKPKKPRAAEPEAIQKLRAQVADLKRHIPKTEAAKRAKLRRQIRRLEQTIVLDPFETKPKSAVPANASEEYKALIRQRDERVKILRDIRNTAKKNEKLASDIDATVAAILSETLPTKPSRPARVEHASTTELRSQLKDLTSHLAKTEAGENVKLIGQIKRLDAKLKQIQREGRAPEKPGAYSVPSRSAAHLSLLARKKELEVQINRTIKQYEDKGAWYYFREASLLTKIMSTAIDLSGIGKQAGVQLVSHPVRSLRAVGRTLSAIKSDADAAALYEKAQQRENWDLYVAHNLPLNDPHADISAGEEVIASRWAQRIPGVAASTRVYAALLNEVRMDAFDALLKAAPPDPSAGRAALDNLADFVGNLTGRGDLGAFKKNAEGINATFFSGQWIASRIHLLTMKNVRATIGKADQRALRRAILTEYARYGIAAAIVAMLAEMAGYDVEKDPRSSDFMKIKDGYTRVEFLAGLGQITVFASRIATGKRKSSTSGRITRLDESPWSDFGSTVQEFVTSKFAPLPRLAWDIGAGEHFGGEPVTVLSATRNLFAPLSVRDLYENLRAHGLSKGAALVALNMVGFSVQTYGTPEQKRQQRQWRRERRRRD